MPGRGMPGEFMLCDARLQRGPQCGDTVVADGAEKLCVEATFGQSSEEKNG
jgi:hypothetical protein